MDQAMPQEKLNEEMKKLCDRKLTGSIRHQLHTTLSLNEMYWCQHRGLAAFWYAVVVVTRAFNVLIKN